MTKDEISARLDKLNVEHDKRASKADLADLLAKHRGAAAGKVICRVLRDFWPTDDENDRVRKGEIVEVDTDAAFLGIETGTLERVK